MVMVNVRRDDSPSTKKKKKIVFRKWDSTVDDISSFRFTCYSDPTIYLDIQPKGF